MDRIFKKLYMINSKHYPFPDCKTADNLMRQCFDAGADDFNKPLKQQVTKNDRVKIDKFKNSQH
jgi:hypothetical protein